MKLADLSRQYADGDLSRADYRRRRAQLIDAATGDDNPFDNVTTAPHRRDPEPPPVLRESVSRTPPVQRASVDAASATPPAAPGGGAMKYVVFAVIGVVALATVWVVMRGEEPAAPPVVRDSPVVPEVTADTSPLDRLLQNAHWSATDIADFSNDWHATGDARRAAVRNSPAFLRLSDMLNQRIVEQRALQDAGAGNREEMLRLIGLADTLALDSELIRQARDGLTANEPVGDVPETAVAQPPAKQETSPAPAAPVAPAKAEIPPIEAAPPPPEPAPAVDTASAEPEAAQAVHASEPATVGTMPVIPAKVAVPPPKPVAVAAADGGCSAALAHTRKPTCSDALKSGGRGPLMVVLNGGDFIMGSEAQANEQPPHPVRIRGPLAMSVYEVTQGEFAAYCRAAQRTCPARAWPADDYPVVNVSWQDARDYARWLSEQTGQPYRLPSEAEWEFAARAGSTTAYPFGDDILITGARFSDVTRHTAPLPISDRSINRNRFRLYHMVGNVREWVADAWRDSYQGAPADGSARGPEAAAQRVIRGGGYADGAHDVRSASRMPMNAGSADRMTGFRVVRGF